MEGSGLGLGLRLRKLQTSLSFFSVQFASPKAPKREALLTLRISSTVQQELEFLRV